MKIKDPFKVNQGIDLFMKKVEVAPIAIFREFVWQVFCEILEQTPQWSGKAVANWNIGVGAPDYSWDENVGEKVDSFALNVLQKGDNEWIEYAKFRNAGKLKEIKRREKVFITNSVWGDDDNGKASSNHYLEALQDPSYWQEKLRTVNKPYEVATETMIRVIRDFKRGKGLALTHFGGDSFEEGL
jgi:hypothetical protein